MKTLFTSNTGDTYNLSPMSYPWAYSMYKRARKNFWTPEEINMSQDISSFATLEPELKEMFLDVFATLTTSDLVVQENIALRLYQLLDVPELRLWLGHQIADESLHSHTYQHIIENLALGDDTIYGRYKEREYIAQKFSLAKNYAAMPLAAYGDWPEEAIEQFIVSLAFYYLGFEGIWFYHGFSPILALGRAGKVPGTISQLLYIARDEITHVAFGVSLLRSIKQSYGFSDYVCKCIRVMFEQLVEAEVIYASAAIPKNIVGYSAEDHIQQTKYMVNFRLRQVEMAPLYPEVTAPGVTWLAEMLENRKERNFFETRVTEYQVGGLSLDTSTKVSLEALLVGLT